MKTRRVAALVVAAAVVAAVAVAVERMGGAEEAIYGLLPHVPIDLFQNFSSVYVRATSCHVLPALRAVGLLAPALKCLDGADADATQNDPMWVIVAGPKGGTVLAARMGFDLGAACGRCVGIGYRAHGRWPTCEEQKPTFDSDVLLAIANLRAWPEYVAERARRHANQPTRCVVITRNPFARFRSLYQYAYDASEFDLRPLSLALRNVTVAEGVALMWRDVGRQTMKQSHEYVMESLARPECVRINFEDFGTPLPGDDARRKGFRASMNRWFDAWGISPLVRKELLKQVDKHDLGRFPEDERRQLNHHVSGRDMTRAQQQELVRAINATSEVFETLRRQAEELGYE